MSEAEEIFTDNAEAKQFELNIEGKTARIEYALMGNKIIFNHTEVPIGLEGKGVGSKIVELALKNIEERNLKLIPLCPFTAAYIKRHPHWKRVLDENVRIRQ